MSSQVVAADVDGASSSAGAIVLAGKSKGSREEPERVHHLVDFIGDEIEKDKPNGLAGDSEMLTEIEQQKHELEFWRQLKYGKDYKGKTELLEPTRRVYGKTSPLVTT